MLLNREKLQRKIVLIKAIETVKETAINSNSIVNVHQSVNFSQFPYCTVKEKKFTGTMQNQ